MSTSALVEIRGLYKSYWRGSSEVAVLVDLWAPWCGPCRFVSPILEELARDFAGRLKVIKVNVDDNPALSRRFDAMSA